MEECQRKYQAIEPIMHCKKVVISPFDYYLIYSCMSIIDPRLNSLCKFDMGNPDSTKLQDYGWAKVRLTKLNLV